MTDAILCQVRRDQLLDWCTSQMATGRGVQMSAQTQLREALLRKHWPLVVAGRSNVLTKLAFGKSGAANLYLPACSH